MVRKSDVKSNVKVKDVTGDAEALEVVADEVTFIDSVYRHRVIHIGKDSLCVVEGRVSVSDPAHIEALDAMPEMEREDV